MIKMGCNTCGNEFECQEKKKPRKGRLIWTDIRVNKEELTPTYYFDFDLLNEVGFPDGEIFNFIEEMKTFAEKEIKERSNKMPIPPLKK